MAKRFYAYAITQGVKRCKASNLQIHHQAWPPATCLIMLPQNIPNSSKKHELLAQNAFHLRVVGLNKSEPIRSQMISSQYLLVSTWMGDLHGRPGCCSCQLSKRIISLLVTISPLSCLVKNVPCGQNQTTTAVLTQSVQTRGGVSQRGGVH